MILTLISPVGERWTIDPAPPMGTEWAAWLAGVAGERSVGDLEMAAKALVMLRERRAIPPKGKALLAHTAAGWQAILSNP